MGKHLFRRQHLTRWLSFTALLGICSVAMAQDGVPERQHPCGLHKMMALRGHDNELWTSVADTDTDLRHYKLEIEILPSQTRVQGTSTVTLDSTVDNLTSMRLYLDSNGGQMSVSSVSGAAAGFSLSGDVLTLTLDRAYAKGEQFTVAVNYSGVPKNTAFGSFLWGTHGSSNAPAISSLSEPFFARTWWPCKDVLNDKADSAEVWITVPNTLTGVSNGTLVGVDTLSNNRKQYRWTESYPIITYLVSIACSDYGLYQLNYDHLGNTMPMTYYLFPEHNVSGSSSRAGCDLNKTQVEKFSDVFGQYPFINEKYGMAEVVGASAYMEHQTCSSMLNVTNEGVNSHELCHQWWGDMVTCGNWADIWLNEGFATYGEAIWMEQKNNGSFTAYRNEMLANYPSNVDTQVLRWSLGDVNHIFAGTVYYKGAWVLHMLRGVIGYNNLLTTLANYRQHFLYKSTVTSDFAAEASAVWGRDMTFFFDEWINKPGAPDYKYNWRDDVVNGQHRLRLALWQTQNTRGYTLITMPVPFRVVTSGGTVDISLWSDDWTKVYDVAVPGTITSVSFDPNTWLLIKSQAKVTTTIPSLPLLGDMNADGKVNLRDVPIFQAAQRGEITNKVIVDRGDFNYNGIVDSSDSAPFYALVKANSTIGPKR